jgi:hypothetical protein
VSRTVDERVADVRRLLAASRVVHADRARVTPAIARATGLSPEGVELGFASLEQDATDGELRALVDAAGDTARVHVVLSANVFVAPLRAMALARAAAEHVTVRPSPRDPVLARALVDVAGDTGLAIVDERDVASVERGEIHVYGRDATIDSVRARARSGVRVLGHGAGMGVAVVTRAAVPEEAAAALAVDVVAFDQRGCLSPRVALVEGEQARAAAFAEALHAQLLEWDRRVPRGVLPPEEATEAARWRDVAAFAGPSWSSPSHAVALASAAAPLSVPPPGRHLLIVPVASRDVLAAALAPLARFLVAAGTDAPADVADLVPAHARLSALGVMQRPPLDGPVDRRLERIS